MNAVLILIIDPLVSGGHFRYNLLGEAGSEMPDPVPGDY